MELLGWLFVILLILLVILTIAGWMARRQAGAVSYADPAEIARAAAAAFGTHLWVDVSGPGRVNKRRRALRERGRSTVSVGFDPTPDGGTLVTVWMSEGARFMELADAIVIRNAQQKVLTAVAALPSVPSRLDR